jgi:hypothetical protein
MQCRERVRRTRIEQRSVDGWVNDRVGVRVSMQVGQHPVLLLPAPQTRGGLTPVGERVR